jgi:hypothetical protein
VKRELHRQVNASVEASGPHDFAVRLRAFVSRITSVHRSPRPTFVTIAKRPSLIGHGMAGILPLILATDQLRHLRPINATGKSGVTAEIVSSAEQLLAYSLLRHCDERSNPPSCPRIAVRKNGVASARL